MPNYKLVIQYEGTRYKGWQEQKNTDDTIQGKIRRILERMSGEEIDLQGSGRTDAGVHAKAQVAHFHMKALGDVEQIQAYLNEYLPEDIAVSSVELAEERFHARLNARSKTYEYRIYKGKKPDVFARRYVVPISDKLDVEAMRRAASYLEGSHDFKAFCGNRRMKKSTVRRIFQIEITETEPGFKGDTAQGATKPAIVETGASVNVPLFVEQGDVIKIDTRTGEYLSRI